MPVDPFIERIEKIRARFSANLSRKIDALDVVLPQLSGAGEDVIARVATAHRSVHELCGMGPTVGFTETGRAARVVERILLQPLRAKRGLTKSELDGVKQGLAALRSAAQIEAQRAADNKTSSNVAGE